MKKQQKQIKQNRWKKNVWGEKNRFMKEMGSELVTNSTQIQQTGITHICCIHIQTYGVQKIISSVQQCLIHGKPKKERTREKMSACGDYL